MTAIGKLLVFLNLVLGVGLAVSATAVYTQRPGWFETIPEGTGIDKGQYPVTFAQLNAEIDVLGKQAVAASSDWGTQLASLKTAEEFRKTRSRKMEGLLALARNADPTKKEAGFLNLKTDPSTKLLDLDDGVAVKGPDNLSLGGTDQLLGKLEADAKAVHGTPDENNMLKDGLAQQSAQFRADLKTLGEQVVQLETQVLKQRAIRDQQMNEAAFLAAFEVNVSGQLDTVRDRKRQLLGRLNLFIEK